MSCRSLQNIALDKCATNKGGILKVWIGERNESKFAIETSGSGADAHDTGYITISDTTTNTWKYFEFRKASSSFNSELTVDDANGILFSTNTLVLNFAKQEVAKRIAVQSLIQNPDLMVVVKDANNNCWFMGADSPVSATAASANFGQAATDANQYSVTLTDISNELPYAVKNWVEPTTPTI